MSDSVTRKQTMCYVLYWMKYHQLVYHYLCSMSASAIYSVLLGREVQCVPTYYTTSIYIAIEVIQLFKLRVILDVQLVIVYQFLCILSIMLCEIICINMSFTTLANKCTRSVSMLKRCCYYKPFLLISLCGWCSQNYFSLQ